MTKHTSIPSIATVEKAGDPRAFMDSIEASAPTTQPVPAEAPPHKAADVQAAVQREAASGNLAEKPPLHDWITRDRFDRSVIRVQHKELGPEPLELELVKMTFNVRHTIGRFKGQLLGAFPDPDCFESAEFQAVVTCGIKWPDTVSPGDFMDEDLMTALYHEVNVFWGLFRSSN